MNWSATAVDGGGVEIKPLSQEEALARQNEIRHLEWFAPNWEDATIDAVRIAERYWRKYCDVVGADYKEYLLRGDEAVYNDISADDYAILTIFPAGGDEMRYQVGGHWIHLPGAYLEYLSRLASYGPRMTAVEDLATEIYSSTGVYSDR